MDSRYNMELSSDINVPCKWHHPLRCIHIQRIWLCLCFLGYLEATGPLSLSLFSLSLFLSLSFFLSLCMHVYMWMCVHVLNVDGESICTTLWHNDLSLTYVFSLNVLASISHWQFFVILLFCSWFISLKQMLNGLFPQWTYLNFFHHKISKLWILIS